MTYPLFSPEYFMNEALKEAQKAYEKNEIPVGAVITLGNKIIAKTHNYCETLNDATAHAEMQAITAASNYLGNKFLEDCTLYVTLEPCPMCAGALYWSRIGKVYYGASDAKRGYSNLRENLLHPKTVVGLGVLEDECSALVTSFFKELRA